MSQEPTEAQNAQGAINQHFGDEKSVSTSGGDSADGNIDKRTIVDKRTTINVFMGNALSSAVSKESMQALLQVLEHYGNEQLINQAYKAALQDALFSPPNAQSYAEIVAQLENSRRLPQFVKHLADNADTPDSIRKKLGELGELSNELTATTTATSAGSNRSSVRQSYLQLVFRPDSSGGLLVNAWLIPDELEYDPAKRYRPLDLANTQKGVVCQIEEASKVLNQFLVQALQHLVGQHYNLTIEAFLPQEYLCADVDAWKLPDLFFEDETYPVGTKYQVVVRSQERLDSRYLKLYLNQWYENWARVKDRLPVVPDISDFEHLSQMDICNWKQLTSRLKQKLGLKVSCELIEIHQKNLFTSILKSASPIVMWPRIDLSSFGCPCSEIDQLVSSGP